MSDEPRWRDHYGLHRTGWGDRLVPEAMAHPAKVRPDLAQKIVSHALAEGWWHKGDTLIEPFMGIGGFGLVGGWNGLHVVGVELEAHFVALCEANIALHAPIWGGNGCVAPVVIHGDSRNLRRLVGAAMGSVASPPYASSATAAVAADRERDTSDPRQHGGPGPRYEGGTTPGNLGNLPCGSVSSPPYAGVDPAQSSSGIDLTKQWETYRAQGGGMTLEAFTEQQQRHSQGYGHTDGQLGRMPTGSVSSPPYADDAPGAGGLNTLPPREGSDDQSGRKAGPSQAGVGGCVSSPPYSESLQNPGGSRVKEGFAVGRSTPGAAGSVSSPPYVGTQVAHDGQSGDAASPEVIAKRKAENYGCYGSTPGQLGGMPAGSVASPPYEECGAGRQGAEQRRFGDADYDWHEGTGDEYGDTAGQLGNERAETFWQALRVIASELHALLPPGAVSAWVVKDFVRNKARVPFCDDCATLLTQCGFTVFERWRCWMVSKAKQEDMFTGEVKPQRENKGFFRRLAEAMGSPRIDFEEVIWFVRNDMPLFQET